MPFYYHDGHLWIGQDDVDGVSGRDLLPIARSHDKPIYVYALSDIRKRARRLDAAFGPLAHGIHYAMKANANPEILRALAREGLGVDTVSGGEIEEALAAGFAPDTVIFSGVGKTRAEVELAVRLEIKQINVESPQELERIGQTAARLGKTINVAFRMNPDVNPKTHPYITTGFRENKFGMDASFLPELRSILSRYAGHIRLRGLTMHIGSQLTELSSVRDAIVKTKEIYLALRADHPEMDRFDIGGGLGINYESADTDLEFSLMDEYGRMSRELLGPLHAEVITEPGRVLVARAGLLIGEVQYIKRTPDKVFAILNTGMHHLIRPALYQARHRVLPVEIRPSADICTYDVVGPICESSDFLAKNVSLPELRPGDYVAIADAGAYGYSMASHYNKHSFPSELVF
jgi:diaminopimelate decarboxylase